MMLQRTSPEFRTFFLMQFTKELILNSIPKDILLKEAMKEPEKELEIVPVKEINEDIKEMMKPSIKPRTREFADGELPRLSFRPLPTSVGFRPRQSMMRLRMAPKLPQHLQYIQPVPMPTEIDLEKINSLIKDSLVQIRQVYLLH